MGVFTTMLGKLEVKFCLMETAISNTAQDVHNVLTHQRVAIPGGSTTQLQSTLQRPTRLSVSCVAFCVHCYIIISYCVIYVHCCLFMLSLIKLSRFSLLTLRCYMYIIW